jgi:hypothetical protein
MYSVAKRMRADFEASAAIKHRGAKGSGREEIVAKFVERHVPGHMRVAHSAELISSSGEVSRQCDIAVYDDCAPMLLDLESHKVLPIECIYATVEVKSQLSKAELLDACENLRRAKSLPRSAFLRGSNPSFQPNPALVGIIFAFDGPAINSTVQNMWEWARDIPPSLWPDCIWVLGRGFVSWVSPENEARVDPVPSPGTYPLAMIAEPETDILLAAVMQLSILLANTRLDPVDLRAYAMEVSLGTVGLVAKRHPLPGF